ncbi:hypothetical protein Bca52824_041045 [Brassica carinata]|uniref:Uncharacterized protein n=1 Tax=Brassica carinata TaxID=52824 RepID=A0A8X7UYE7_BRACI|nr:hypothetical protein Bca52824_041045 [Brassica carinata]
MASSETERSTRGSQNPDWETDFNRFEQAISSSSAPIRVRYVMKLSESANRIPESILSRAIPILARLLGVSGDPSRSVQSAAAHCLKRIACIGGEESGFAVKMGRCGVIACLLGLLFEANGNDIALRRIWVKCLWSLVTFGSSIRIGLARLGGLEIVVDSGAIPLLVEILKDGSVEFRERVCGAISQLSYNEDDREAFSDSGMIPILIDWLGDESEELRDNAAEALVNFSEDQQYYGRLRVAMGHPVFRNMQSKLARIRASHELMVIRSMTRVTIEPLARDQDLL